MPNAFRNPRTIKNTERKFYAALADYRGSDFLALWDEFTSKYPEGGTLELEGKSYSCFDHLCVDYGFSNGFELKGAGNNKTTINFWDAARFLGGWKEPKVGTDYDAAHYVDVTSLTDGSAGTRYAVKHGVDPTSATWLVSEGLTDSRLMLAIMESPIALGLYPSGWSGVTDLTLTFFLPAYGDIEDGTILCLNNRQGTREFLAIDILNFQSDFRVRLSVMDSNLVDYLKDWRFNLNAYGDSGSLVARRVVVVLSVTGDPKVFVDGIRLSVKSTDHETGHANGTMFAGARQADGCKLLGAGGSVLYDDFATAQHNRTHIDMHIAGFAVFKGDLMDDPAAGNEGSFRGTLLSSVTDNNLFYNKEDADLLMLLPFQENGGGGYTDRQRFNFKIVIGRATQSPILSASWNSKGILISAPTSRHAETGPFQPLLNGCTISDIQFSLSTLHKYTGWYDICGTFPTRMQRVRVVGGPSARTIFGSFRVATYYHNFMNCYLGPGSWDVPMTFTRCTDVTFYDTKWDFPGLTAVARAYDSGLIFTVCKTGQSTSYTVNAIEFYGGSEGGFISWEAGWFDTEMLLSDWMSFIWFRPEGNGVPQIRMKDFSIAQYNSTSAIVFVAEPDASEISAAEKGRATIILDNVFIKNPSVGNTLIRDIGTEGYWSGFIINNNANSHPTMTNIVEVDGAAPANRYHLNLTPVPYGWDTSEYYKLDDSGNKRSRFIRSSGVEFAHFTETEPLDGDINNGEGVFWVDTTGGTAYLKFRSAAGTVYSIPLGTFTP